MFCVKFDRNDKDFSLFYGYVIRTIIKAINGNLFLLPCYYEEKEEFRVQLKYKGDEMFDSYYKYEDHPDYNTGKLNPLKNLFAKKSILKPNLNKKYIGWFKKFTNYRIEWRTSVLHSGRWQLTKVDMRE